MNRSDHQDDANNYLWRLRWVNSDGEVVQPIPNNGAISDQDWGAIAAHCRYFMGDLFDTFMGMCDLANERRGGDPLSDRWWGRYLPESSRPQFLRDVRALLRQHERVMKGKIL